MKIVFIILGGVSSAFCGVFYQIKYNDKRPLSILKDFFNIKQSIVKETIGVGVNEKAVLRFYQTALSFTSISIFPW